MAAYFKEIKTEYGLMMWVCILNGKEVARSWSLNGVKNQVLSLIRRNKDVSI